MNIFKNKYWMLALFFIYFFSSGVRGKFLPVYHLMLDRYTVAIELLLFVSSQLRHRPARLEIAPR